MNQADIPTVALIPAMRFMRKTLDKLENIKTFMRDETDAEPSDQDAIELAIELASASLDKMAGLTGERNPDE